MRAMRMPDESDMPPIVCTKSLSAEQLNDLTKKAHLSARVDLPWSMN